MWRSYLRILYPTQNEVSTLRIHSGKMLLKRVHFTQIGMLPSEGCYAVRNANECE
jgi:hypothetical protein